jgi:arginyl-tRNA--protein-N-Asp/Glu arginylyltransferase
MSYFHWKEQTITDFSDENVTTQYARGFVFTRLGKGVMHQTRSARIDLSKYSLNSENRRILKKTLELIGPEERILPIADYNFKMGKLAKDFYDAKFGSQVMSAQKTKEMLTDTNNSNFNRLFVFRHQSSGATDKQEIATASPVGYAICYCNQSILHYSYPFYDLNEFNKDTGLGMMIRAIEYAKKLGIQYCYLGSLQRPTDTYKMQFEGFEWYTGTAWSANLETAKDAIKMA